MAGDQASTAMQRICAFAEEVLPRDLQLAQEELQRVKAQEQEYEQLLAELEGMQVWPAPCADPAA